MAVIKCIACNHSYELDHLIYRCECQGLVEVCHDETNLSKDVRAVFDERLKSRRDIDRSGVWRFREGILPYGDEEFVTQPEGGTPLYLRETLSEMAGVRHLYFKHEGMNPSGSFKDRGMTCAVTQAKRLGMNVLGCASTGNTSASLAAYGALAGLKTVVFLPKGKVARGKLAQALGYGAYCIEIDGDFDAAMTLVQELADAGDLYMVNSLNPFRLEGQKSIMWEMLQDLDWQAPDWVVVPGGNLGNTSAFGKALKEAHRWGWIDRLPRLLTVQAVGASPFFKSFERGFDSLVAEDAETLATAIRIGNPVNYEKAKRVISDLDGLVTTVCEQEILECKAAIDVAGIGCEPASACTLAGIRKLAGRDIIKASDRVVAILTGHILKDPDIIMEYSKERLRSSKAELAEIRQSIESLG